MGSKRSYLLAAARSYVKADVSSAYDEAQQINMVSRGSCRVPLVGEEWFMRTASKTMQAPGDDDPDPEDEGCY
ncbi:MAG: hypothetical protein P8090_02580 [Gammaproteobacteria bacterium]